jgi:hypothetical protein
MRHSANKSYITMEGSFHENQNVPIQARSLVFQPLHRLSRLLEGVKTWQDPCCVSQSEPLLSKWEFWQTSSSTVLSSQRFRELLILPMFPLFRLSYGDRGSEALRFSMYTFDL